MYLLLKNVCVTFSKYYQKSKNFTDCSIIMFEKCLKLSISYPKFEHNSLIKFKSY